MSFTISITRHVFNRAAWSFPIFVMSRIWFVERTIPHAEIVKHVNDIQSVDARENFPWRDHLSDRFCIISLNMTEMYYIFAPVSWWNFRRHFLPAIFFHRIFCNIFLHRLLIYPRVPFVVEGVWNHSTCYTTLLYERLLVGSREVNEWRGASTSWVEKKKFLEKKKISYGLRI